MKHPVIERPGFCSVCYCERCGSGFYERARDAIRFSTGVIGCAVRGCTGEVRNTPPMLWRRLQRCARCGPSLLAARP